MISHCYRGPAGAIETPSKDAPGTRSLSTRHTRNSGVFIRSTDAGHQRAAPVRGQYGAAYLALTHEARRRAAIETRGVFRNGIGERLVVLMTREARA